MIWTFSGPAALHAVPTPLHSSCATAALQNVVQYTGSAADREIIRQFEFNLPSRQQKGRMRRYKFNVLLTSYETLLRDKRVFMVIWRTTPWLASATCFEVLHNALLSAEHTFQIAGSNAKGSPVKALHVYDIW